MRWSVESEHQHGKPGGTQITLVLSHWSSELLWCIKYEWEVGVQCRACSLRSVLRLGGFLGCKHNSVEVSITSAMCVLPPSSLSVPSYFSWAIFGQICFLSLTQLKLWFNNTGRLWFHVQIQLESLYVLINRFLLRMLLKFPNWMNLRKLLNWFEIQKHSVGSDKLQILQLSNFWRLTNQFHCKLKFHFHFMCGLANFLQKKNPKFSKTLKIGLSSFCLWLFTEGILIKTNWNKDVINDNIIQ